jgi:hypothetical protein
LANVLAFHTDGDTVLYVTDKDAPSGKVLVRIRQKADDPYTIRQLPAGGSYLVHAGNYNGDSLIAAGVSAENKVYIYKNPIDKLKDNPKAVLVPVHILKVDVPNYVSFSPNDRVIMAENSGRFAVYDAETDKGYAYTLASPLDQPQVHAAWMDGFRLDVISGERLVVFDYDGANQHKLSAASPLFLPAFDRDYRYVYTLTLSHALTNTALLAPQDL